MELSENLLSLIILAFMIAAVIKLIHYSIGGPKDSKDGLEFNPNAIFSFYGRWVVQNYAKFQNKEIERKQKELKKLEKEAREAEAKRANEANEMARSVSIDRNKADKIHTSGKVNIWLPLGICILCFGAWFAAISFAFILPVFGFSFGWFPFVVASSAVIAKKL